MTAKKILVTACIFGGLSVAIGAFGAHGLSDLLAKHGRLETFEVAVKYQLYHTLALLAVGILMLKVEHKFLQYTAWSFIGGIIIFSGSLYILSLTNFTFLGAITPLGGVLFILGWIYLTLACYRAITD